MLIHTSLFLNPLSVLSLAFGWVAGSPTVAEETYSLKPTPKVGDVNINQTTMEMMLDGVPLTARIKIRGQVVKVTEDGSATELFQTLENKVTADGQEFNGSLADPQQMTTSGKGHIVSIVGGNANSMSYRMAWVRSFLVPDQPVKVGETWKVGIKGNPKVGSENTNHEYKLLGIEKLKSESVGKVQATVEEASGLEKMSSAITFWVRLKDGLILKTAGQLKNVVLQDGMKPTDMKISSEIVSK